MKKKSTIIISLGLATAIAVTVAGCSAKEEKPEGKEVSSIITSEIEVTDSQGEAITDTQGEIITEVIEETATQTTKKAKNKKKDKTTTNPYIVTDINGKPITTSTTKVLKVPVTNKKGEKVTKKNGQVVLTELKPSTTATTIKREEGMTEYTTASNDGAIVTPDELLDDEGYVLSDYTALFNLQNNYPDLLINPFPDYDPGNTDIAYFAVYDKNDTKLMTHLIWVDLTTGEAKMKDLKTNKITKINAL